MNCGHCYLMCAASCILLLELALGVCVAVAAGASCLTYDITAVPTDVA
jgi:hypothetical protein